jgi:hypothetical protein
MNALPCAFQPDDVVSCHHCSRAQELLLQFNEHDSERPATMRQLSALLYACSHLRQASLLARGRCHSRLSHILLTRALRCLARPVPAN